MRELKNVITINDFNYSQGGASKVAIDTANMLAEEGYNSVFISAVSNNKKCSLNKNVIQYNFNGNEFLNYNNKLIGMIDGLKCKKFSNFVRNILNNYSPEDTVVHVHGWTKACSSDFFNILKSKGFKTFLTLHDYFSVCPNGAFLNFKSNKCCGLRPCSLECLICNCDSRNYLFKAYRFIREKKYYKDIDFNYINLIFVSKLQKNIILSQRFANKETLILDSAIEELDKDYKCSKKYDFVFIGRDSAEKGIELFIELAKRMKDYLFLIVGNCDRMLPNNVKVSGWVNELEVEHYLKDSKCLIVPSLLPEPFGLVVPKAISFGIKCIASDNIGAASYINKQNGMTFKQGDINDLESVARNINLESLKVNSTICITPKDYLRNLENFYTK